MVVVEIWSDALATPKKTDLSTWIVVIVSMYRNNILGVRSDLQNDWQLKLEAQISLRFPKNLLFLVNFIHNVSYETQNPYIKSTPNSVHPMFLCCAAVSLCSLVIWKFH